MHSGREGAYTERGSGQRAERPGAGGCYLPVLSMAHRSSESCYTQRRARGMYMGAATTVNRSSFFSLKRKIDILGVLYCEQPSSWQLAVLNS